MKEIIEKICDSGNFLQLPELSEELVNEVASKAYDLKTEWEKNGFSHISKEEFLKVLKSQLL